ncbi:hypothetical protein DFH09DRAFT_1080527 [Mycena vulgaris]|nr:hypothetical protein DFH09DRAFT_1080527 [Mycena vulgaris]
MFTRALKMVVVERVFVVDGYAKCTTSPSRSTPFRTRAQPPAATPCALHAGHPGRGQTVARGVSATLGRWARRTTACPRPSALRSGGTSCADASCDAWRAGADTVGRARRRRCGERAWGGVVSCPRTRGDAAGDVMSEGRADGMQVRGGARRGRHGDRVQGDTKCLCLRRCGGGGRERGARGWGGVQRGRYGERVRQYIVCPYSRRCGGGCRCGRGRARRSGGAGTRSGAPGTVRGARGEASTEGEHGARGYRYEGDSDDLPMRRIRAHHRIAELINMHYPRGPCEGKVAGARRLSVAVCFCSAPDSPPHHMHGLQKVHRRQICSRWTSLSR